MIAIGVSCMLNLPVGFCNGVSVKWLLCQALFKNAKRKVFTQIKLPFAIQMSFNHNIFYRYYNL